MTEMKFKKKPACVFKTFVSTVDQKRALQIFFKGHIPTFISIRLLFFRVGMGTGRLI